MNQERKPIVFACSGCSFAGRLAYDIALELDRRGVAEMSCLAGVGAQKRSFLKKLKDREVWLFDGCPIECALGVFAKVNQKANRQIRLHDYGIKKENPPPEGINLESLVQKLLCALEVGE